MGFLNWVHGSRGHRMPSVIEDPETDVPEVDSDPPSDSEEEEGSDVDE